MTDNTPDKGQMVDLERFGQHVYHWAALMDDGGLIGEFDHDPTGAGFASIDLDRCVGVLLQPNRDGLVPHMMQARPELGERAAFFRRHARIIRLEGPQVGEEVEEGVVHIIGWRWRWRSDVAAYTFVLPDGRCLHTSDFDAM